MAVAEEPIFDVDAYASRYTGVGKVRRLAYLAERAGTPAVRTQALIKAAEAVLSDSLDARLYRTLSSRSGRIDDSRLDELARAGEEKLASVNKALEIAKARSLKDEIVKSMAELAAAHRDVGDLQQALVVLQTSREYAPSAKHVADINLHMLELSLLLGSYATANSLIMKLQTAAANAGDGGVLSAKLRAAQGLISLSEGHYEGAARELLALPQRLGGHFSAVAHIEDLASIGGLCALATYSRDDLRSKLLGEPGPRALLELVPQLRDAVQAFVASRYAACLEGLGRLAADALRGDLFLGPHAERLLSAVRRRALTQYLTPYTAVDLSVMAAAFRVPVPVLEGEIVELIVSEGLQARLDSERKLLLQHSTDARADALGAATAAARAFGAEARMLLLRANMELEGVFVGAAASNTSSSSGGSGGGAGSGAAVSVAAAGSGSGGGGADGGSRSGSGAGDAAMAAAIAASLAGDGDGDAVAAGLRGDRERLADADVLAAHAREAAP